MPNSITLRLVLGVLVILAASSTSLFATHNRAGEIQVEQTSNPGQVRITITTYTAFLGASAMADRDSIAVLWGDGTGDFVIRQNGPLNSDGFPDGERIGNNLKKNVYVAFHTYSNNRGTYRISMSDINRVAGTLNISDSINKVFYVETIFTFLDPRFQGLNSTPQLLQAPIDNGCVGELFVHNPNAFDPDGDSLAYRLGIPRGEFGIPLASYRFPNEFGSAAGPSNFTLDEVTGTLLWDSPRRAGNYNAVISVISYRNGIAIDTTLRDMQIFIAECDNLPPAIEVTSDVCLIAGEELTLNPVATAPIEEDRQQVMLEVTSATLELDFQPATWDGNTDFNPQPYTAEYNWQTACEHVAKFPYNIIFKATDNFALLGGSTNLSWLEVVEAKVSAPPPENIAIESEEDLIDISWDAPYACEVERDSFFYGFSVWRREGTQPLAFDSCRQGLAGLGYTRITRRTREQIGDRYVFTDDDVERGRTYCYRVLAQFVRYTESGRPFNLVESIPSMEVCIQSSRDLPLLTRVDVLETSTSEGRIDVRWTAPLVEDLDTLANPAPYVYELLRSPGVGTSDFVPVPGTRRSFNTFTGLQRDTQYIDEGLNTVDQGYAYALEFTSAGSDGGISPLPSSSIYLKISSRDRTNVLAWDVATSWEDTIFYVLREGLVGFDTIAQTTQQNYVDEGLENGTEYCYQIIGRGSYGVSTISSEIINRSQQRCRVPRDLEAPCPPPIAVETICDNIDEADFDPPYPTTIAWSFGADAGCEAAPDLVSIRVYELSDSSGTNTTLLGEVAYPGPDELRIETEFDIAGCYAVSAVDSVGNESQLSASVCVSNCPLYVVPNVITPNGDNVHDVLRPRRSRFVERVVFQLYNRWGNLIFETEDPDLGWDGTLDGRDVNEGTYFYTVSVFERSPTGGVLLVGEGPQEGFVEVLR